MDIRKEIRDGNGEDLLVAAQLASAYTLLALAPYDSWSHEGTPAEMAAFVVIDAKKQGRMGFVRDIVTGRRVR